MARGNSRLIGTKIKSNIQGVISVLAAIFAALFIGAIFLLIQKQNIFEVYFYLLIEPLKSMNNIIKVLGKATPLIFTGLAVAVSFKCGIFNIGAEGQLLFGALAAAVAGHYLYGLPPWLHMICAVAAGMLIGALYSLIPAFLKVLFNVHEVVSTIMLNNVASAITSLLVVNTFRQPGPHARTFSVAESVRFFRFAPPEHLNIGFIFAVVSVIILYMLMQKTPLGYRIDIAGKNMTAARFSGINSKKLIYTVMLISGALSGLCGAERVLGAYGYMQIGFSPGYGFDGITIAIIGRSNPVGVLLTALFIGLLQYGGVNINIMTDVPYEWVQALIAIMFIFVAVQDEMLRGAVSGIFRSKRKKASI